MNTILVVDDEPCIRELIRDVLEGRGCQVLEAADVNQGVRLCRTEHPDLVLVDLALAGSSGIEVLRSLQQSPETAAIPAVLMSGYATDESVCRGMPRAPAGYLTKPFGASDLMRAVAAVLWPGPVEARAQALDMADEELQALPPKQPAADASATARSVRAVGTAWYGKRH